MEEAYGCCVKNELNKKNGRKKRKRSIKKKKANSDLERVKYLSEKGMLIKNIPYEIVPSNVYINGNPVCCLKIIYKSATGTEIPLISDQKFNGIYPDKDGTCDLLIDSNDYSNYFIDFEII